MTSAAHDDGDVVGEDVWLMVPSQPRFLRTVRLVAADAGVRAGLDCHEVEDFRIGVDELCHLLMSATDGSVSISFGVVGDCAIARGFATRRAGAPLTELGELSRTIISSVADYFETSERGDEIAFAVMKQRTLAALR